LERIPEGLSLLHHALKSMEALGIGGYHSLLVAHVGEVYLLDGRLEDALAFGHRALALTRQRGERGFEAWALRLLAEVASYPDPPDVQTTEDHYRRARALADELGMRPLVAHCHLGLGKLYRRTRDRVKAQEHLTTAATMYREMGMSFWLKKAEAELGPPHENSP
jgi:tetratricopeptide (TPR) repeat protein